MFDNLDILDPNADLADFDGLIKALLKELGISYTRFGWIWIDKFIWNHASWNEFDKLGVGKQIAKSLVSMMLSDPVTVWTPSENINKLIELELFGRMKFNSTLSENLTHCMINGDMVMYVDRDIYDNELEINYVQGQNIIPLDWNNHTVNKLGTFTREYIGKDTYVIVRCEDKFQRVKLLFKYTNGTLSPIDFGTNDYINVIGKDADYVDFSNDPILYNRFAWVSTARQDEKWKNTPFHNSFLYPLEEIKRLSEDWDLFCQEMDLSPKTVFADPEIYETTNQERARMGMRAVDFENQKPKLGGLIRMLTVNKDKMYDVTGLIRFNEWYGRMKFDLQMICLSRGLNASILQLEVPTKEMTATESVLSNKQTQNTIKDIEANLKPAIQTIVYALINEWYKEGRITDEDFALISSIGCIDVQFSDGFFRNREQTVNMMLGVWNAPTIDGSKLIDKETFLKEALGWTKEHCQYVIAKSQEEMQNGILLNAQVNAQAQLLQANILGDLVQQQAKQEKKQTKKEEKKK